MNYTELPLPQRQREAIHRILSDASDRDGGVDSTSILRSLQELATDDVDTQTCFAEIVIPLLETCLNSPTPEASVNNFSRFTWWWLIGNGFINSCEMRRF